MSKTHDNGYLFKIHRNKCYLDDYFLFLRLFRENGVLIRVGTE